MVFHMEEPLPLRRATDGFSSMAISVSVCRISDLCPACLHFSKSGFSFASSPCKRKRALRFLPSCLRKYSIPLMTISGALSPPIASTDSINPSNIDCSAPHSALAIRHGWRAGEYYLVNENSASAILPKLFSDKSAANCVICLSRVAITCGDPPLKIPSEKIGFRSD